VKFFERLEDKGLKERGIIPSADAKSGVILDDLAKP